MIVVWVGVGAAVGAPLRYLTDRALQHRFGALLPVGTLAVNLVASFLLGLLAGVHALSPAVAALVGSGFCGALSTWSTFGFETVRLIQRRDRMVAALHLAVSVLGGVGLAALGWAVTAGG